MHRACSQKASVPPAPHAARDTDAAPLPPIPADEARRLAELETLSIVDTAPEDAFDDLAMLASEVCGTPIAAISLIDRGRQWFKARVGLAAPQTPRDLAFCAYTIVESDGLFVVPDATADVRFVHNPLVAGEPGVRFYAGAAIVTEAGHALGTVCVIDTVPRTLGPSQARCLRALARQATGLLEMRERAIVAARFALDQANLTAEARLKHERGAELLDLVLQGRELGLWDLDVRSGRWFASTHELEMLGMSAADGESAASDWRRFVHPDDRAETVAALRAHQRGDVPFHECSHRMLHADGRWIWVVSRAVVVARDADGLPTRIVGTHRDVTAERKRDDEQRAATERLAETMGERRHAEEALVASERRLRLITDNMPGSIMHIDGDGRYQFVNRYFQNVFGIAAEAILGRTMREVCSAATYALLAPHVAEALAGRATQFEWTAPVCGEARHFHSHYVPDVEADGRVTGFYALILDITARKQAELRSSASEKLLRGITDNLPVCISEIDTAGLFRFANATYRHWMGVDPAAMIGRSLAAAIGADFHARRVDEIARAMAGERVVFDRTETLPIGERTLHTALVPHFGDGRKLAGIYVMTTDITEQTQSQRRLDLLARSDALTGLPNRRHFEERAVDLLAGVGDTGRSGALLFLDVDHFKSINDSLGHGGGDELLEQFAARLKAALRDTDFVARYAGDEFVAVVDGVAGPAEALALAHKVADAIREPFALTSASLYATASVGIAMFDNDATLTALLARADAALYEAKAAGRDCIRMSTAGTVEPPRPSGIAAPT